MERILTPAIRNAQWKVAHYAAHIANPDEGKPASWHALMRISLAEWQHKLAVLEAAGE